MQRILLTGMSATGKSTLIGELAARGYKAVDLDADAWSEWAPLAEGAASPVEMAAGEWQTQDWVWREDRVRRLLDTEDTAVLFVSGCASNQATFYPRFDEIILLSAPTPVLLQRLATRTTNSYGKHPEELARIVEQVRTIEPLLRRRATVELDTSDPLDSVVERVVALIGSR